MPFDELGLLYELLPPRDEEYPPPPRELPPRRRFDRLQMVKLKLAQGQLANLRKLFASSLSSNRPGMLIAIDDNINE